MSLELSVKKPAEHEKRIAAIAHDHWKESLNKPYARELRDFTDALISEIPPEVLAKFPFKHSLDTALSNYRSESITIGELDNAGFSQVIDFSAQLNIPLQYPEDVKRILLSGYRDTRNALLHAEEPLIGRSRTLEEAIASATHPETSKSIARLALNPEDILRSQINLVDPLPTAEDEESGVRYLALPKLQEARHNHGCPYASQSSRVEPSAHEAAPLFRKFTAYVGETAARLFVHRDVKDCIDL